jgi:hypothetical protein
MAAEYTVTLTLSKTEEAMLMALACERGLGEPADALRALLHDAVEVYDALWDKTFAESQDVLDMLADEAHAEYLVGLTEDLEFNK